MIEVEEIQPRLFFHVPPPEDLRWVVDRANPSNPFHDFVGNDEVVKKLSRLAFTAMSRVSHSAADLRRAFLGPSGVGKTTAARNFGTLLDLPFAEVNPSAVVKVHDLFTIIAEACAAVSAPNNAGKMQSLKLQPQQTRYHYIAPEMIVFIDEVHQLPKEVEQALLTATEPNTHMLMTNEGFHLDTRNICWIIATTDIGSMFHALRNRFSRTDFQSYTQDQIAKIIQIEVGKRKRVEIPLSICQMIASYSGPITREGIDFGVEVILERSMSGATWADAVETIRREKRIDEFGMTETRVKILQALGTKGAMAKSRVCLLAQCRVEELETEIMPPLLIFQDGEPMVVTTSRGLQLTERGIRELQRRGIKATAKAA